MSGVPMPNITPASLPLTGEELAVGIQDGDTVLIPLSELAGIPQTVIDEVTANTAAAAANSAAIATYNASIAANTSNIAAQTTKLTAAVAGRGVTAAGHLPITVGDAGGGAEAVIQAWDPIQNDVVTPGSHNRDRFPHNGRWIFSQETQNGGLLGGISADGRHSRISSIGSPRVFSQAVTDPGASTPVKQLFVTDGLGPPRRITMSDVDCNDPEVVHYGLAAYSRADGGEPVPNQGGGGAVAAFPAQMASQVATFGERTFPTVALGTGGILYHVITYGQSLGVGSVNTGAAWLGAYTPHPPSSRIKMFVGGAWPGDPSDVTHVVSSGDAKIASLVPAFDSIFPGQNYGTTGGIELCWMLAETFGLDGSNDFLYSNHSVGEQPYSALMQGQAPYNNILTCVTKAKALATSLGYAGYQVLMVYWNQGEADSATAEATYLADLQALQANLTTDIYAITGQVAPAAIPMFVSQKSKPSTMATVSTAELAANLVSGSKIYCAYTEYPFNYANTAHFTSFDYRAAGAYVGKVAKRVLFDGKPWKPLYALSAVRYGTFVEVQFNVPEGPLVLDASFVADPGNYGFQWNDSTNSVQVNGVWLKAGTADTIVLSLTGVPTGTGPAVGIGYYSLVEGFTNVSPNFPGASQSGRLTGMRACLRDSDNVACPGTGRVLHNWAHHQTIAVTIAP